MTPVVCAWLILQAGAEQMWWHLLMALICISLVASQVEQLSTCPSHIWSASPVKYPFMPRAWFSLGLSACLYFYLFELNPRFWRRAFVSQMLYYLLLVFGLPFHFLNCLLMNSSA